jgi:spermidine synthase
MLSPSRPGFPTVFMTRAVCNVMGNAAGAVVTGLVLLHWVGTVDTIRLIGLVALAFVLVGLTDATPIATDGSKPTAHRRIESTLAVSLLTLIAIFPSNGRFWSALHGTSLAKGAIAVEDRTGVSVLRAADGRIEAAQPYGGEAASSIGQVFY